jgi:hypothetical protein
MDRFENQRAGQEQKTKEFIETTPYGSAENWKAQLTPEEIKNITPPGTGIARSIVNGIDDFANKIVELKNRLLK